MNGMLIETQERMITQPIAIRPSHDVKCVAAYIQNRDGWQIVAEYRNERNRDRAYSMLENAIATGVRLFRFPTDAEVEGEEE